MCPSGERSRFQLGLSPFSTPANSSRRRLVSLGICPCLSRRHLVGSLRPYPCLGPHHQWGKSATFQYSTLTDRSRRWIGQRKVAPLFRGLSHHRLRNGRFSLLWAARNRYYRRLSERGRISRNMRRISASTSLAIRKTLRAWISH